MTNPDQNQLEAARRLLKDALPYNESSPTRRMIQRLLSAQDLVTSARVREETIRICIKAAKKALTTEWPTGVYNAKEMSEINYLLVKERLEKLLIKKLE